MRVHGMALARARAEESDTAAPGGCALEAGVTVRPMRVSAKADYALRAMLELAAADGLVTAERLATAQSIPRKFLESILLQLRHAELVASQRGVEGGHALARPASEISVADVIRAVEGPIATVRGTRPEEVEYVGAAAALQPLWLELRAAMREVLEGATLADLLARSATPPAKARDDGD